MDAYWGHFPTANSSVAGTSELFSSTFAMLSGEGLPYQEQWNCEVKPVSYPGEFGYAQQPATVHDVTVDYGVVNQFEQPLVYAHGYDPHTSGFHAYPQIPQPQQNPQDLRVKSEFFSQKIDAVSPRPSPAASIRQHLPPSHPASNDSGLARRPSSVCGSENPSRSPLASSESGIENDGSPGGSEVISTDLEGPDDVRVMCLACKGLYPSRRSLTGHIGRNEKCREIIDQVAAGANPVTPGTEAALRAGALTNGQDGLSPVCPHCDKFISHYKGNIRRHINSCGKNGGPRKPRPDKDRERKRRRKGDDGPPAILQDGFEPTGAFQMPVYNPNMGSYLPSITEDHLHMNVPLPADPSPPNPPKTHEPPEDAYICCQCEFVTIYKGNMKRHLNTCHKAPECKDLKEWDRKLESMRASSLGISREEMLDRLHLHKMNSTRGRKPGRRSLPQDPAQHPQPLPMPQPQHMPQQQQPHQPPPNLPRPMEHMVMPQHVLPHPQEAYAPPPMHFGYDMGGYL